MIVKITVNSVETIGTGSDEMSMTPMLDFALGIERLDEPAPSGVLHFGMNLSDLAGLSYYSCT